MLYDDDWQPRRLHHQLHVFADAAASRRHRAGATRSGQARPKVNLEITVSHRYEHVAAAVPGRRSSTRSERRPECRQTTRTTTKTAGQRTAMPTSYDAIVVGGGHNGLVNGAYLAKAGLRTLIIERRHARRRRRHHRGAVPGLPLHDVLLRAQPPAARHHPRARADKHGFMPILMPSVRPDGERRLPAARPDHGHNLKEIARHSSTTRTRSTSTATTWTRSTRRSSR